MATFNDSARPRYLPLTRTRQLEVDYLLDAPSTPVALTVVDSRGREIESDDVVIALAWRLSRGLDARPRTIVDALQALLDVALARRDAERAARNLELAEEHDACAWVDAPIDYEVVDPPSVDSAELWESCFGADPEAPETYALTEADVDELARRESLRPFGASEVAS